MDQGRQARQTIPSATIFLWWADIAQAAGDRARAQLYIECAFEAIDRDCAAQIIRPIRQQTGNPAMAGAS